MKTATRYTGKLLSVSESVVGTTLSADAALGATTLYVDDVSVFDESGWLKVGSQVTKYMAIDDDAGTVTIPSPGLTAAADTDDVVARYSKLYASTETVLSAQVAVLGTRDQADELTVEVADWLDIPTGDRGIDGENCTIEADGDVWTLISAPGRPSKVRGWKWFWETPYTLTSADITAGTATIPLTYRPDPTSTELWWRRVLQDYGTDYTVNAAAQTITLPLGSFCQAGDTVPIHYRYRTGLAKPDPVTTTFTVVGSTVNHGFNATSIAFPAGTRAGDLFVYAATTRAAATNTCTDTRATALVNQSMGLNTVKIWGGTVSSPGTDLTIATQDLGGVQEANWGLLVVRPDIPVSFDPALIVDSGTQGSGNIPALTGPASGAIGVGFDISLVVPPLVWQSPPWTLAVNSPGSFSQVCFVTQQNTSIAATPALAPTADAWRGFVIGLGLG